MKSIILNSQETYYKKIYSINPLDQRIINNLTYLNQLKKQHAQRKSAQKVFEEEVCSSRLFLRILIEQMEKPLYEKDNHMSLMVEMLANFKNYKQIFKNSI